MIFDIFGSIIKWTSLACATYYAVFQKEYSTACYFLIWYKIIEDDQRQKKLEAST